MLKRLMIDVSNKLFGADYFNGERQSAFLRNPLDQRAKDLLELLVQMDKGGGAPPATAAAPAPAPAPATDKPRREPRTAASNGASNGATNGTAAHQADADGLAILQGLANVIEEVKTSLDATASLVKTVSKSTGRMDAVEKKIEETYRIANLSLAIVLQLAENQLGAPAVDILESAATEFVTNYEAAVKKLVEVK
jgi:hypothetical protein